MLFNILVEPVMSYACQVWGPHAFGPQMDSVLGNCLGAVQESFIRCSARLAKQVHEACLLLELGHMPIVHQWVAPVVSHAQNKFAVLDEVDGRIAFHAYQQTCN